MGAINDGFRFLLELCGLAALAVWGFQAADGGLRWVLGLGAPVLLAVIWGTFMSPQAPARLDDPLRLMAEIVIFGTAAAALAAAGHGGWALALGAAVAVHLALTFPLDQR